MPIRCLAALVAGLALALSFPPTHAFWLMPFAVATFFVVTAGLPARSAWLPGLAFGAAFQFTLLWWMHAVGTVPWLALSAIQAGWYAVLAVVAVPLRRLPAAPVWLAVAYGARGRARLRPLLALAAVAAVAVVPLLVPYEASATSHATVAAVQGN